MDGDCTHQPIPKPQPAPPPAPAPAAPTAASPQEATGDSESDSPSLAAAGYAEDDAESCSGAGGGDDNDRVPVDDVGRGKDYVKVTMEVEGDENEEVDSRMCRVPWWRRTGTVVQDAAAGAGAGAGAGGGCARPQVAAEGGAAVVAGANHTAESNRLFWEACIAHGY